MANTLVRASESALKCLVRVVHKGGLLRVFFYKELESVFPVLWNSPEFHVSTKNLCVRALKGCI